MMILDVVDEIKASQHLTDKLFKIISEILPHVDDHVIEIWPSSLTEVNVLLRNEYGYKEPHK